MQLRSKAVADTFTCASWYFDIVSRGRQIANDLRAITAKGVGPETASNEGHVDGPRLFVGEGEEGLGRLSVHKLDTKNLRLGKRG